MRTSRLAPAGLVAVIPFLAIGAPEIAHAQPAFEPGLHIETTIGATPRGSAVADFDRDGHIDFAVACQGIDSVTVLLGDGRGGTRSQRAYATADTPTGLAAADFNGDGLVDLAVTSQTANVVSILLGKPLGEFGAHADYATAASPYTVAVADFDNDAKLDLVVTGIATSFSIHRGTGTGAFLPKTDVPGLGFAMAAVAGDVDNDGAMDVVTLSNGASKVLLYRGDGAGGFAPRLEYAVGLGPAQLALGDLNADGILDVVTANYDEKTVSYLYGTGTGFGAPANTLPVLPSHVGSVAIGDLNGDGRPDLVANQTEGPGFKLYRATAGGGFATAENLVTLYQPQSFHVRDVDHDGRNDLVAAMDFNPRLSIHRAFGTGPLSAGTDSTAVAPGPMSLLDVTGDGFLDLVHLSKSLNAISYRPGDGDGGFGARVDRAAPAPKPTYFAHADIDGDGRLDLAVNCDQGVTFMDTVFVLKVTGALQYTKTAYPTGSVPGPMAFGRANADTLPDLAIVNMNGNTVSVILNDGTGGFGTPRVDYAASTLPRDVVFADIDGDGDQDLAYVSQVANLLTVRRNDGTGAFGGPTAYQTAGGPYGLEAGDFNGDGRIDLVAGTTGAVSMFLNVGGGLFAGRTDYTLNASTFDIAIGDVDKDGRLDVAVANLGDETLTLFLGDGQGKLGPRRNLPATGAGWTTAVALGDVDGDGRLDAATAANEGNFVTVRLSRVPTATALAASPNPCALGGMLTLTATVTVPDGTQAPAGIVRFYDGLADLGTAPLVGNVATFAFPASDAWFRTFSAEFLGADRLRPSRSRPVDLMVFVANVDVPPPAKVPGPALVLTGARPNPVASGRLRVHFALPTDAPARLELFDVGGRRVATKDVSGLGAGFHSVPLDGERPLPAGVYHVRLTQGAETRVARAVITH